jgi:hypothetical protein
MNTAALAAASDPDSNVQFCRRWTGPPPVQRIRPALAATSNRAELFDDNNSRVNTKAGDAAARACEAATRRIAKLELRAGALNAIGLRDAALRLRALAEAIRMQVLA